MHYIGISTQFIQCYASAIHKHSHTRILRSFEDSKLTGLKVDIAAWQQNIRCWCAHYAAYSHGGGKLFGNLQHLAAFAQET